MRFLGIWQGILGVVVPQQLVSSSFPSQNFPWPLTSIPIHKMWRIANDLSYLVTFLFFFFISLLFLVPGSLVMEAGPYARFLAVCSLWSFCRCKGLYVNPGMRGGHTWEGEISETVLSSFDAAFFHKDGLFGAVVGRLWAHQLSEDYKSQHGAACSSIFEAELQVYSLIHR